MTSGCDLHGPTCSTPCPVEARVIALVRSGALRLPKRRMDGTPVDARYDTRSAAAQSRRGDKSAVMHKRGEVLITPKRTWAR